MATPSHQLPQLEYAREPVQGPRPSSLHHVRPLPQVAITHHLDVRRSLSDAEGGRTWRSLRALVLLPRSPRTRVLIKGRRQERTSTQ